MFYETGSEIFTLLRKAFATALLFCTSYPVIAQSDLIRLGLGVTKPLNENWEIIGAATWRKSITDYNWRRYTIDLTAAYLYKSFRFQSSFATFYSIDEGSHILELRPWQGVSYLFSSWNRVKLSAFLRAEERFQLENDLWSFSLRFRSELSAHIAINNSEFEANTLYLIAGAEYLNNFNEPLQERFSDTRTLYAGLGFMFSKNSTLELTYESDVTENTLEAEIIESDIRTISLRWQYTLPSAH